MQELGEGSRRGGGSGSRGQSGVGATISRVMVGTLRLWLCAWEGGANAVDLAASRLDIGVVPGFQVRQTGGKLQKPPSSQTPAPVRTLAHGATCHGVAA